MIAPEFVGLCCAAGFFVDSFREPDAHIVFAQSMMIQPDELHQQRHIKMSILEFIEAVARAADAISFPPSDSNVCFV